MDRNHAPLSFNPFIISSNAFCLNTHRFPLTTTRTHALNRQFNCPTFGRVRLSGIVFVFVCCCFASMYGQAPVVSLHSVCCQFASELIGSWSGAFARRHPCNVTPPSHLGITCRSIFIEMDSKQTLTMSQPFWRDEKSDFCDANNIQPCVVFLLGVEQ